MVDEGRAQNVEDDRQRFFEACRQDDGQELGFVANFCKGDHAERDEEGFHVLFPGRRWTNDHNASPTLADELWSKVLPKTGFAYAMTMRPSMLT